MILLKIIWAFFKVGLFSFGGGYAAIPLIREQVVDINAFLSLTEFTDIVTISQITPGPIGINLATFTGIKVEGVLGGVLATVGCVLPSCIIVTILAILYNKYKNLDVVKQVLKTLRPAVVALIGSAGISILLISLFGTDSIPFNFNDFRLLATIVVVVCFIILRTFKINPIYLMLSTGIIGGAIFYFVGI